MICKEDGRFDSAAYLFVRQSLDYTLKHQKDGRKAKTVEGMSGHHVSGQALLDGIRAFALEQFGPMTYTVFDEWGIRKCGDFGNS